MTTDLGLVRWNPNLQHKIVKDYERSRIKALADEREIIQKQTFQKWVNSHLVRVNCRITDLYTDMRDGQNLIKLLKVLSGECVPSPTKGNMRIHCLENVDKALQFLQEHRVHLENMGSHDIVDGNPRLMLGLIWTLILRFQIQDITIKETDNQKTKSAKDALLLWCQMKTAGYNTVCIRNFSSSWRDGVAFNALIHKHRPDLIQFEKISKSNPMYNLNNAFNVAEDKLGLTKLLDAEDVFVDQPDEKSIITYIVTYYHYFSKMKEETVQGKRIGKVIGIVIDNERMTTKYESLRSDLLAWIEVTIKALGDRNFANSLSGVRSQLGQFNSYRIVEKPPMFVEKGNLEILLFTLQSKMRANNQRPYTSKEGNMISDINMAWERLEKAEHECELALREELIRQEKLENLAVRFYRKASMRETWLSENHRLVSHDNFGQDLAALEAAVKKQEAIETDIFAYEERVLAVVSVAAELEAENYYDIETINARKNNVLNLWNYLLELLRARRTRLDLSLELQHKFQEMLHIRDAIKECRTKLLTVEYGKHLMDVEDLIQKHNLLETDVNILGNRVKGVATQLQQFLNVENEQGYRLCDPVLVLEKVHQLEGAYAQLVRLAVERRLSLEESKKLWQFYWDMADEENWIKEKEHILSTSDIGHDLATANLLLRKHQIIENELVAHESQLESALSVAEELINGGHLGAEQIQRSLDELRGAWKHLLNLGASRRKQLEKAVNYHQLFTDADEIDIWMLDILKLISSEDVGRDEGTARSLLKKHKEVTKKLKNYGTVIEALHNQAEALEIEAVNSPVVSQRLASIYNRWKELLGLAKFRKQCLLDALSLYKLILDSEVVEQWINEKYRMLQTMNPARDIEDVEIMKHRLESFEKEMNTNTSCVAEVNQLARQLLHVEHPKSAQITDKQNQLNQKWAELREKAESKKEELNLAHAVQTFYIECRETTTWIEDKIRILQTTDRLEMDLTGILILQRRLSGLERDLAALQSKLSALQKEANSIAGENPDEAAVIKERLSQVQVIWESLTQMLKERNAKLEEAGELHRFFRELDHFQAWLKKAQTFIASEDNPNSLLETEKLLSQHQGIRKEINNYTEDYTKMMEYGEKITADPCTRDNPQYMFLREHLKALRDGWDEIQHMWQNRQQLLSQSLSLQLLDRDVTQCEVILNKQEHTLGKDENSSTVEQAENLLKRHEAFLATMQANDDQINTVVEFSRMLGEDGHSTSEKISKRIDNINKRRQHHTEKGLALLERFRDQLEFHQFLRDCDELGEWIQEKHVTAEDETYRSAKTVHSKWTRHQAFEAEIAANKERLHNLQKAGEELATNKPWYVDYIRPKVGELVEQFDFLKQNTTIKGERLFNANREVLIHETCDDIDSWMNEIEKQIERDEAGEDLASVRILIQKQQMIETQMRVKAQQLKELEKQTMQLETAVPGKEMQEIKFKKTKVELRFEQLKKPLLVKQRILEKKKEALQFRRDVEDELLWITEKMPLALSTEYGNSLFQVLMLKKKNQWLQNEVDNHEPIINTACNNGQKLIEKGHEDATEFNRFIDELHKAWQELKDAIENRHDNLLSNELAQQYLFDASEAESWMSEQELYMMVEDTGRDETSARNLIKKHESLEVSLESYGDSIRSLAETARALAAESHPLTEQVLVKQSQLDQLYAAVKDLAVERRAKLDEALQLFLLMRNVEDMYQCIADREIVATSQDLGQDYDHVTLLWERFNEFSRDTKTLGSEKLTAVNEIADQLIAAGHSDTVTIAEWKDGLNEEWQDLLELIETRSEMLAGSRELYKFFHDCKDMVSRILEKQVSMPDDLGRDADSVKALHRKHINSAQDLKTLQLQVQQIDKRSVQLQTIYVDNHNEIVNRIQEVYRTMSAVQAAWVQRHRNLVDSNDLFKFTNLVRTLMQWMDEWIEQMHTFEKRRDTSGVDFLIKNHQTLMEEIEGREDYFTDCISLGERLLYRDHYASAEITNKLVTVKSYKKEMMQRWDERWDYLLLASEVDQYAKDAFALEAWMTAQEPYLRSPELGNSVDAVEDLIRKHEEFEKLMAAQEGRCRVLECLTLLERELKTKQEKAEAEERARKDSEESERLSALPAAQAKEINEVLTDRPDSNSPAMEEQPGSLGDDEGIEGHLVRKHEWENTTTKATNRSWDKVYCVVREGQIIFYKDAKIAKTTPEHTFKGEPPLSLRKALANVAGDYKKKNHVFRLKLENEGQEFLFQANEESEMNTWISHINAHRDADSSGSSTSQTLPASPRKAYSKRRFFTLKKI